MHSGYFRLSGMSFYGIFSLVFYCLTIVPIVKIKTLRRDSFYRIYLFSAVVNILTYINSYASLRVPQNTCNGCPISSLFSPQDTFISRILLMLTIHFAYVQYLIVLITAINRFSVVVLQNYYKRIWSIGFFPIIAFVCFSPFAITYSFLVHPVFFTWSSEFDGFMITSTIDWTWQYRALAISMVSAIVLSIILSGTALGVLYKRGEKKTSGRSLLILCAPAQALVILAAIGWVCLGQFYYSLGTGFWNLYVMPLASDGITLTPPFLLMFCSQVIKKQVFKIIRTGHINQTTLL